jgi:hypothetical protein
MKYFDTHYHAVGERIEAGSLCVAWVPSHEQKAGCPNKFNTWARPGFTAISQLGYAEGYKQGSMDILCFFAIFSPFRLFFSGLRYSLILIILEVLLCGGVPSQFMHDEDKTTECKIRARHLKRISSTPL